MKNFARNRFCFVSRLTPCALRLTRAAGASGKPREMLSALFEVPILVEGGAGRGEKDRVSGPCQLGCPRDRALHVAGALDLDLGAESGLDGGRGLADRQDAAGGARQCGSQRAKD